MNPIALARLDAVAIALTLALPPLFMHARGIGEGVVAVIDLLFLIRCAGTGAWAWLRTPWVMIGAAWWLWLVFCSLPFIGIGGTGSLIQALAQVRFLLLVAALETVILARADVRRWLIGMFAACAIWIAGQTWIQFIFGVNLGGYPRRGDGELTGPFMLPRAAAPLSRLLFPTLLPLLDRLLQGTTRQRAWAALLAIGGVGTVVLIGQRMPLLLTALGLVAAALLLPRLRRPLMIAFAAGALLLAATPIVSPPTFYRLVTKFSDQMARFANIDYGLMAARSVFIAADHPITGRGYDGFRNACPDPQYFRTWSMSAESPQGGGTAICNIHPHNHYLEQVTNAGIPGLILFSALMLAWLIPMAQGLRANPDPLRVGLFVAALIQEWPISAHSGYTAVEIAGFFFLIVGCGLALRRAS